MNILILDGSPEKSRKKYDDFFKELSSGLEADQHRVKTLTLRDMDIRYCTGCWSCWWGPTPGECAFKDDSHAVCREYIHSDFVIFASPLIFGFTSALLKKTQDKLIPLLHPYLQVEKGESRHYKRYENYPKIGLLVEKTPGSDDEDMEITVDLFRRFALNFKTELVFAFSTDQPVQEVRHAVNHI